LLFDPDVIARGAINSRVASAVALRDVGAKDAVAAPAQRPPHLRRIEKHSPPDRELNVPVIIQARKVRQFE
jgi:hypothetical protein